MFGRLSILKTTSRSYLYDQPVVCIRTVALTSNTSRSKMLERLVFFKRTTVNF